MCVDSPEPSLLTGAIWCRNLVHWTKYVLVAKKLYVPARASSLFRRHNVQLIRNSVSHSTCVLALLGPSGDTISIKE